MVIANTSSVEAIRGASGKLRRSRRLSSTRGLKVRAANGSVVEDSTPRQDLNQKLGLCPIVSRNVEEDPKRRTTINWELNERISLSSGSSTGIEIRPDTRRGIEFGENRRRADLEKSRSNECRTKLGLDLMNVSGFPQVDRKHRGSWTMEIEPQKEEDGNVIKSDSKYEIGIPSQSVARKEKLRRQSPGSTLKSQKSVKNETGGTGTGHRKWSKDKADKNDSISKRLELIHELNQKILANYERFQQRSKRHTKDPDKEKEGSRKDKDSIKSRSDKATVEADMYSEVKRKTRVKGEHEKSQADKQRKLDTDKFTFSKDYCERLTAGKDHGTKGRLSARRSKERSKSSPKPKADVADGANANFILAARSNFAEEEVGTPSASEYSTKAAKARQTKLPGAGHASERVSKSNSVFYMDDFPPGLRDNDVGGQAENDCLESSRLYPEAGGRGEERQLDRTREEPRQDSKPELQDPRGCEAQKGTRVEETRMIIEIRNESRCAGDEKIRDGISGQDNKSLENEILEKLDETIGKFDNEMTPERTTVSSNLTEKSESFSEDSMQDRSGELKCAKDSGVHETFNSSWDSGVGVDVGTGSGWIRIHTGIESSLVYLTLDTTAKDVCRDMLLGDELSLFILYGGEPGRRLAADEKPLLLQDSFLQTLGYQEASRRARLGVDPELRHLIGFHVGPASPLPDLAGYSRCGYALVLKGLVFPQWKRRPLAVIGSRLFLYPACPDSRPEWMELGGGGGAVCYAPSRLGKLVLRVTGFPRVTQQCHQSQQQEDSHHHETRHLYLGFHHPWDRDLWKSWLKQATQLASCPQKLDLSRGGLSRVPDSAVAFPAIEELVLSQNQLNNPNNNLSILHRFPKLNAICLDNNGLKKIPLDILELRGLQYLNLSDNGIETIPAEIGFLVNLRELILDRNGIRDMPKELAELKNLRHVSLAGNCLGHLPSFLNMRALALTDVLSKTDHGKGYKDEKNNHNNLQKVNLRNNQLKGNIILGNYGNLTHLDVSENSIEKLDISALQEVKSVRCARNLLTELTLCGRNLVSLIAGNNKLKKLTVEPVPTNLEHLDVSYNNLDALPEWTPDLPVLRALFASHNALTALPDRLLSQPSRLEVLHLPHNRLQALPPPRRPLNIVHLTLQDNALTALPTTFFPNTEKMKVLNLSNNRLSELPYSGDGNKHRHSCHTLEKLYLTANCLTDRALDTLARFKALRVLHIAYNILDTLPESCIASWSDIEELVLSGNRLQYLPDNAANLQHLRVLRVHSNRLLTCPTFSKTTSLKILDLAHNQLDRVNLAALVPPQLQFLDISCNSRLHVDPRQFQVYRSQRPISLVDVSGQNRPSLPSHPHQQEVVTSEKGAEQPWRLGFSETAGSREKLYVSQIRMPSFCNVEGLFGIFDGGSNQEAPTALQEMIPRLLLEERTVRETSKEYLKYALLSAHRELKEKGQKYGIDATLIHIIKLPTPTGYPKGNTKYSVKVASSGDAKAVLCRAAGPLTLAPPKKTSVKNQIGNAAMFPLVVPDPTFEEVVLEDDDEFVIVANRRLWEVLSVQEAVREARAEASPVLAAKRLQDLAQAYGAEDNISVIVVRLTGPRQGDLDQLMRELRHAVGKNRGQTEGGCACACCVTPAAHKPPGPCCCHANEGYYLNGVVKNIINRTNKAHNGSGRYFKNPRSHHENESPPYRDDRSSPSGQSDQASDSTFKSRHPSGRVWSGSAASRAANKARQSVLMQENGTRKVSSCLPAQEDAVSERSGALSEEQFRCWEYMLEQNSQLLFDKELDTLTRAPLRRGQSRSTPQLAGNLPFLSKRFGSARSFNPGLPRPPVVRFGSGRRLLNGGPNAAYFGSLQRLMPYNLEYDFAVIQERGGLDSLEQDASRMQQYWGVATTEL